MPTQSTPTILIVDDEPNLRHTLSLILEQSGYQTTTAGSGVEALSELQEQAFNLVFLDLKMPDMDGLTLLPQIRNIYPDMPVFILTAHATLDSAIQAVRQGARDYLLKPLEPEEILNRVQTVLAENTRPQRRRQLVSELQQLLTELGDLEGVIEPEELAPGAVQSSLNRYMQCGPFQLDLRTRFVLFNGQSISLPPATFDYLVTLARHAPETVPYQQLVQEAQGYETTLIEAREMARWRIHELRKALEPDSGQPRYIITIRGEGYRLVG